MLSWTFFTLAIPVVLLVGLSKGGFGGGLALLGVPLLALLIDPRIAVAILLPILCVMDVVGLLKFKGQWHFSSLKQLIPGALLGTLIGALTFTLTNADMIRIFIGVISLYFVVHYFWTQQTLKSMPRTSANGVMGLVLGTISGFASYIAHAGGPPVAIYLVPQKLPKAVFASTTILFFSIVNFIKLIPYSWLGQINTETLFISLMLLPVAPIGVLLGNYFHHKISEPIFYKITCCFLFIAGIKLTIEGVMGLTI